MHESITIADVGSMVNVSGRRMATPFGPPSPGRTPTKMPRTRPTIISASVFQARRTPNPCSNKVRASIAALERDDFSSNHHPALSFCLSMIFFRKPVPTFRDHALKSEGSFERAFRHDDVECKLEGDEHRE